MVTRVKQGQNIMTKHSSNKIAFSSAFCVEYITTCISFFTTVFFFCISNHTMCVKESLHGVTLV